MLFIGLSKGVRDHIRHYFIAITEDGETFDNREKETLEDTIEEIKKIQEETGKEINICFDHWGAASTIIEIAEMVSQNKDIHLILAKIGGERESQVKAEQIAINAMKENYTFTSKHNTKEEHEGESNQRRTN